MSRKLKIITAFTPLLLIGVISFSIWKSETKNQSASAAASRVGLVGHWTMDENDKNGTNYYDRSGFGNTATSTNSPTIVAGKINQAISFNGSTQYLSTAANFSSSAGTISFWEKSSATGAQNDIFFSKNLPGSVHQFQSFADLGNSSIYFRYGNSSANINGSFTHDGGWHNLVFTWNSTGSQIIYKDGVLLASGTTSWTAQDFSSVNLNIGGNIGSYYFSGSIDDFRIYNRVLSATEVGQLYSSAKTAYTNSAPIVASSTPSSRLVGHWTMDSNDISGISYFDKSGFNNTATSTGSPTIAAGKINQAVSLNATTNYLDAGDVNYLDGATRMTISLWIKPTALNVSRGIIQKWMTNQASFLVRTTNASSDEVFIFIPNALSDSGSNLFTTSNLDLANNIWTHLIIVYNGTLAAADRVAVYKNNSVVSGTISGTIPTSMTSGSTADLRIGSGGGSSDALVGIYDDVRVYNYALTATEVANLYSSAKVNYVASAPLLGLVGHWTMDTNDMSPTGATLYDKSGQNNHGTVTGTTTSTGRINQARSFNGTGNITINSAASINTGTNPFTIATWIKPTAIDLNLPRISGRAAYAFDFAYYNGQLAFYDGSWHTNTGVYAPINQWSFVAITRSGSNYVLYSNGGSGTSVAGANPNVTGNLYIGSDFSGASKWPGAIDDVRIYDRALSAQEVANLYQSAKINYVQ